MTPPPRPEINRLITSETPGVFDVIILTILQGAGVVQRTSRVRRRRTASSQNVPATRNSGVSTAQMT
jgi:hypothetical protein